MPRWKYRDEAGTGAAEDGVDRLGFAFWGFRSSSLCYLSCGGMIRSGRLDGGLWGPVGWEGNCLEENWEMRWVEVKFFRVILSTMVARWGDWRL